jgi:hypothetical protein
MFGHPDDRKMEDLSVWLSLVFSPNTTQLDLIFKDSKVVEVQYLAIDVYLASIIHQMIMECKNSMIASFRV